MQNNIDLQNANEKFAICEFLNLDPYLSTLFLENLVGRIDQKGLLGQVFEQYADPIIYSFA